MVIITRRVFDACGAIIFPLLVAILLKKSIELLLAVCSVLD